MFGNDSPFSKVSPKTSFFAGIGAMLALFFVVGFFVLLFMVMKDKKEAAVYPPAAAPAGPGAPPNITVEPVTDKDWVRGNPDAKIAVVEFSDLECPFCKTLHPTLQRLITEYPDDVKWAYRHFPLVALHSKAPKEAEAAECAGDQGGNDKFWAYIDRLYEVTPSNNGLDPAELPKIAVAVGLNEEKFNDCLSSGKFTAKVDNNVSQAVAAGGEGTPYSVILVDDQKIPISGAVPYENFKSFVDSVLKK